jgi:cytochrome c biogenesis protein CcmG/thiol:disulfide interchange protein DsbE
VTGRLKLGAQVGAVALIALLLALLVWKLVHANADRARPGQPAPDFTLNRLDKPGELRLAALQGKVVVLNFWASWCYACKREAPALAAVSRRWGRRVVVLGVDVNDFVGEARRFARNNRLDYPMVHDNHNITTPSYGLTGLPETFFLDRHGTVVVHRIGEVDASDIRAGIEQALRS